MSQSSVDELLSQYKIDKTIAIVEFSRRYIVDRDANYNSIFLDYSAAIDDLNIAISIDSNFTEAYILRGLFRKILKDYKSALEDLNKALKLDPNDAYLINLKA